MTILLTTHYMEEAANSDDVVILKKGKIIAQGTPTELKNLYGKDRLKIRFFDTNLGEKQLKEMGFLSRRKVDLSIIEVDSTTQTLKILDSVRDNLKDFELIKGNMDDVFLNTTSEFGGLK